MGTNIEVPTELAASLRVWVGGYRGSDSEPALRELVGRIRVATGDGR